MNNNDGDASNELEGAIVRINRIDSAIRIISVMLLLSGIGADQFGYFSVLYIGFVLKIIGVSLWLYADYLPMSVFEIISTNKIYYGYIFCIYSYIFALLIGYLPNNNYYMFLITLIIFITGCIYYFQFDTLARANQNPEKARGSTNDLQILYDLAISNNPELSFIQTQYYILMVPVLLFSATYSSQSIFLAFFIWARQCKELEELSTAPLALFLSGDFASAKEDMAHIITGVTMRKFAHLLVEQDGNAPRSASLLLNSYRIEKAALEVNDWRDIVERLMLRSCIIVFDMRKMSEGLKQEVGLIEKNELQYKVFALSSHITDDECMNSITKWRVLQNNLPILDREALRKEMVFYSGYPPKFFYWTKSSGDHISSQSRRWPLLRIIKKFEERT